MNYSTVHNFRSRKLAILIHWGTNLSDDRYWLYTERNTFVVEINSVCVWKLKYTIYSTFLNMMFKTFIINNNELDYNAWICSHGQLVNATLPAVMRTV